MKTDRRTVDLRFSWEGVLNHTWINPWHSEKGLLCVKDHQKEICHICTYEWRNQCISEYMFDCWISTSRHSEDWKVESQDEMTIHFR